jgi:hypothetical protein
LNAEDLNVTAHWFSKVGTAALSRPRIGATPKTLPDYSKHHHARQASRTHEGMRPYRYSGSMLAIAARLPVRYMKNARFGEKRAFTKSSIR